MVFIARLSLARHIRHQIFAEREVTCLRSLLKTFCSSSTSECLHYPHSLRSARKFAPLNTHSNCLNIQNRGTGVMAASKRYWSGKGSGIVPQDYDYFLVLDFEATCLDNEKIEPQEVIEFPVLKVSGKTFEVESTFHQYVEPQVHGVGEFCTKLTGITPDMVKNQPTFQQTLELLHEWMNREGLLDPTIKSIFVTCGDWDLKVMLPSQSAYFEIPYHSYFRGWINIKKSFAVVTGHYPKGMMQMLEQLFIEHEGRHHSGIDDCRNIAKILKALAERRFKYKQTGRR